MVIVHSYVKLPEGKMDDNMDDKMASYFRKPPTRPGKRLHNELDRSTMLSMGKSTISTGSFSIANC